MRELIRHILKESGAKNDILNLIKDEDIFVAVKFVGGLDNLKRILKNEPKYVTLIDSLKGTLSLVYHSRKEYIEFPMKFEIVGKGENVFRNNSWPIVNLIYDDSKLSESEKKLFEQFVYDSIGDLNITDVDIKPEAMKMFREKNGYINIKYVNGKDWESLDHDIRYEYENNDIKNLHREYYNKSNVNESKVLKENEEDPTQKILNFLLRRYKVEDIDLGWEGNPIKFKTIKFDVYGEKYGFTTFENKSEQIRKIVDMLIIHNVIEPIDPYERQLRPYIQKVIRAVKLFINQVMPDKSNINESKIVDKIKSLFGKKTPTKDDRLINLIAQFIKDNYKMEGEIDEFGTVTIYLTDEAGNLIHPPIMKYYPDNKVLDYSWEFSQDIYGWFSDERLLKIDSEMMGKIFEKLFKKKINVVYGYSRL